MSRLRELLVEYDRLGDTAYSSPHDFTLRQRLLETWAVKAREAIEQLLLEDNGLPRTDPAGLKNSGS